VANWIDEKGFNEANGSDLYVISIYFCITTLTTVGYGDINGTSKVERIFCIGLMLFGVVSFSFATSSLS